MNRDNLILIAMLVVMVLSLLIGHSLGKNIDYTKNMIDCLSKGGKYYLSVESNSDWNYEKCTLDKEITY